ncbi:hypothetical protein ACQPZF_37985 [Actinosynnema sp. CS-041913]|uniref:hypothetical protein n=1 Tax=Actinosynnema sp. CS-041913 TaxID=3239917 RepID=UPI003D923EBC
MRELFNGAGSVDVERSWQAVERAIRNGNVPARERARGGRRWLVAGGVAVAAVVGGTAAVVAFLPVNDRNMAECRSYTSDGESIEGGHVGVAGGSVEDALEWCARMWQDGLLRKDVARVVAPEAGSDGHPGRPFPVPPLVVCVEPGEEFAVVVVGGDDRACRDAGVVPAAPAAR